MDFRNLEYFLAAAEHGSLRLAAQRLGITQPALTKAIKRIEDAVGVPLFDRHARGVRLNAYGIAFLDDARDLNTAFHAVMERIGSLRRGVTGIINIGAGPFWQDAVLPDAIMEMRRRNPDVLIRVMGGDDNHLRELLKSRRLVFILAAGPDPRFYSEPGLEWESLMIDEYCVIADVNHPLRASPRIEAAQLFDYPWILPSHATYMVGRLRFRLRSFGLPDLVPTVETENIYLKFKLMRNSHYLSYHAMAHLRAYNPGFIQPMAVRGMATGRKAGLWKRQGMSLSATDQAFISILKQQCDKLSTSLAVNTS